jgi:hypothetical protein
MSRGPSSLLGSTSPAARRRDGELRAFTGADPRLELDAPCLPSMAGQGCAHASRAKLPAITRASSAGPSRRLRFITGHGSALAVPAIPLLPLHTRVVGA